jgi:hypothetical protein
MCCEQFDGRPVVSTQSLALQVIRQVSPVALHPTVAVVESLSSFIHPLEGAFGVGQPSTVQTHDYLLKLDKDLNCQQ